MEKKRLVMVGNGMAGCRTLEELLRIAPEMYDITVFGAEPHPNYNRILLSPVLAGEMTIQDIILNDWDWYRENGITLHTGRKIVKIDRIARKVIADDGTEAEYDRLLPEPVLQRPLQSGATRLSPLLGRWPQNALG